LIIKYISTSFFIFTLNSTYSQILTLIEDTNIISKEKQKNESDIPKRDVGLTKTQVSIIYIYIF